MSENETLSYEFDRLGWLEKTGYLKRRVLFLDLNHWIRLSDGQDELYRELSEALHEAVDAEQLICPVSPSLLMEVEKRPYGDRRSRYCRLMDRLSGGLSLRVSPAVLAEEFRALALGQQIERQIAYSFYLDAMSRGSRLEFPEGWAIESADQAAEVVFDQLTSWPILEAINATTDEQREQSIGYLRDGWSKLARDTGDWREQNEPVPAKDIEQAEVASTVNSLVPHAASFMLEAGFSVLSRLSSMPDDEKRAMLKACPRFWCQYRMAAALRTHKKTLKENDLWDLEHVVSATPYVDCLACDKGTRHICTQLAGMDDKFGTRIVSKSSEILAWLRDQTV